MTDNIADKIIQFMKVDRREYTIPEIVKGVGLRNREEVRETLGKLEERGIVELRIKGRVRLYRIAKSGV